MVSDTGPERQGTSEEETADEAVRESFPQEVGTQMGYESKGGL